LKRPWLAPLIPVYAAGAALRLAGLRQRRLRWPVVSVGNLSVGGTGKTPFTIALALLLVREGFNVDVLSRGYGRMTSGVARVDPSGSAERYGDEPLVIANEAYVPVFVGTDRFEAGEMAEKEWALFGEMKGVHLLDDGFQHRQLARDVDIVLAHADDLKDWRMPAGNLREPLKALERATVLAVEAGDGEKQVMERLERLGVGEIEDRPIWRYRREMAVPELSKLVGERPVIAFCGIGKPKQFFQGLTDKGVKLAARRIFPDHHKYTRGEIEGLRRLAMVAGDGVLVTTAKDLFRLGAPGMVEEYEDPIYAVDLKVVLEDEEAIAAWLRAKLKANFPSLRSRAELD
jgi:tetraacyldisaccharide 4'-kinase